MALASFDRRWIGGDIRSLASLAETLGGYIPRLNDLTGTLSGTVRQLTSGPGAWQGEAATAFTRTWAKRAATATAMEEYITTVARVIGDLAVELARIEHALERAAAEAHTQGVPVDERTGAVPGAYLFTGPAGPGGVHIAEYAHAREAFMAEAEYARGMAAQQLDSMYQKITGYGGHPSQADGITADNLLGDLFAAPSAARREIEARLKAATGKRLNLDEEIAEANRAGKSAQEKVNESDETMAEMRKITAELDKARRTENTLSKLLDHRVSSAHNFLAKRAGGGRHAAGNTPKDLQSAASHEAGPLEKVLRFGEGIPVLDVAATVAGIGIGTYEDVKGGQPVESALLDETLANTTGTVAGALAGSMIGARLGKLGGPVGVAVGAVVGYGVGDYVHNVAEDVPADIREHGLVQGSLDAAGDAAVQTGDDARDLGISAGHEVEHYWDDIF